MDWKKYAGIIAISAIPVSVGSIWAIGRALRDSGSGGGDNNGNGENGGSTGKAQIAIRNRAHSKATLAGKPILENDFIATEYNTFAVDLDTEYQLRVETSGGIDPVSLDLVTIPSDGTIQKWVVENPFPVDIWLDDENRGDKYTISTRVGQTPLIFRLRLMKRV